MIKYQSFTRSVANLVFALTFILQAASVLAGPIDTYEFSNDVTHKRYNELVKELRCPKCQNQNLADANSPIAADLRQEVYELLHLNKSDGEIVDFMVQRYGEFVLYRPRVSSVTYFLWFGPIGLILIGVGVVVYIVRKKPADNVSSDTPSTGSAVDGEKRKQSLTAEEQQKLDDILNRKH